jgi:hypothetical protein
MAGAAKADDAADSRATPAGSSISEQMTPKAAPSAQRDSGMLGGGIALTAVGGVGVLTGAALSVAYFVQLASYDAATWNDWNNCAQNCGSHRPPSYPLAGIAAGFSGAALVGTGVILIVRSGKQAAAPAQAPQVAWWVPRGVAVDKQHVQLTFEVAW